MKKLLILFALLFVATYAHSAAIDIQDDGETLEAAAVLDIQDFTYTLNDGVLVLYDANDGGDPSQWSNTKDNVSTGNLSISQDITASSFYGNGSNLTGIVTTDDQTLQEVCVEGNTTNTVMSVTGTSISQTINPTLIGNATLTMVEDKVSVGTEGYIKNTGTATMGSGHGIGVLGLAEDVDGSKHYLYGIEGRVNGGSDTSGIYYTGALGMANWADPDSGDGNTFNGVVVGLEADRAVTDYDESTPRNEGVGYGLYIPNAVGLEWNYGGYIADQTSGTYDIGLALAGADVQCLWIGQGADNTDAANGIAFGNSRDTNIYRSAANTLKTDDYFSTGYEGIKRDIIRHTADATDVSNGYFLESWNIATYDKISSITNVLVDVSDSNNVKATIIACGYNGSYIYGVGALELGDICTVTIEWTE